MKTSLKVFGVALVLAIVAVSFAFYTPIMSGTTGSGDSEKELTQEQILRLLQKAKPVKGNVTIVALVDNVLVVDFYGDLYSVLLPAVWVVDGEVLEREVLFDSGYLSAGDEVTVKALAFTVVDDEDFSIVVYLGYEIISNENGVHAYAVLPFNIMTSS